MLIINGLSHWVSDGEQKRQVLDNLSLQLETQQCIALMGDSGCGKTTLLNLIAGLIPIQQGEIHFDDFALQHASQRQLSQFRKMQLGIIFQHFNLLSSLTVQDNIEFSARLAKRFSAAKITELIADLNIGHLIKRYPPTLSGGEMQRVAIARCLAAKPALILADEPTGDLDEANSERVVAKLVELAKSQQTALLMVTHSEQVAAKMDKIYRYHNGGLVLANHNLVMSENL